jgi:hypothetical protein
MRKDEILPEGYNVHISPPFYDTAEAPSVEGASLLYEATSRHSFSAPLGGLAVKNGARLRSETTPSSRTVTLSARISGSLIPPHVSVDYHMDTSGYFGAPDSGDTEGSSMSDRGMAVACAESTSYEVGIATTGEAESAGGSSGFDAGGGAEGAGGEGE